MMSGLCDAAKARPSSPLAASKVLRFRFSKDTRKKRRMGGSSSMTRTVGLASAIGMTPLNDFDLFGYFGGQLFAIERQGKAKAGAAGLPVLGPNLPAMGFHGASANGQPQSRAALFADLGAPVEFIKNLFLVAF